MNVYPAGRTLCSRKSNNNGELLRRREGELRLEIESKEGDPFAPPAMSLRLLRSALALNLRPTWEI
jgi:hypothetical protein